MNIDKVEEAMRRVYLLADEGVIRVIMATVVSNILTYSNKPIWLLLLGASSGGKTALLQTLDKINIIGKNKIFPVDTLTTATFASGFKKFDSETSLLHQAQGGIIVFKDFTTLTSMNSDGLQEIMGQMRAIYDGTFDKKTGNGNNVFWKGKVGMIAGGTIAVQRKMRDYSSQGERFINYILKQPDRKDMTRVAMRNQENAQIDEDELKAIVNAYINHVYTKAQSTKIILPDDIKEKLISVSDFGTLCRTAVSLNRKTNKIDFVHDPEMPARMAGQLINVGIGMALGHENDHMDSIDQYALYQIALDSIPVDRRRVLQLLTKYQNATTKALAIEIGLPTDPVHTTCDQLAAIKVIDRIPKLQGGEDGWELKDVHRDLMSDFEKIEKIDKTLQPSAEEEAKFDSQESQSVDDAYYDKIYGKSETTQPTLNEPPPSDEEWGGF